METECDNNQNSTLGSGDVQGACPVGWHLPNVQEWEALVVAVDGNITAFSNSNKAGEALKSRTGWKVNSGTENIDAYSFAALPAGNYSSSGFFAEGEYANFWVSEQKDGENAFVMSLGYDEDRALLQATYKYLGFSIRCIKD